SVKSWGVRGLVLRPPERLEHGRKDRLAVEQQVGPVAPDDRGGRVGLEGREEGGLPEREGGQSYVRINARTGCGEKEDDEDGQERRRSAPGYQRAPCLRRSRAGRGKNIARHRRPCSRWRIVCSLGVSGYRHA